MGNMEKAGIAIVGVLIVVIVAVGLINRKGEGETPPLTDGVAAADPAQERDLSRRGAEKPKEVEPPVKKKEPVRPAVDPSKGGGEVVDLGPGVLTVPPVAPEERVEPAADLAAGPAVTPVVTPPSAVRTHKVAANETMSSIALKYYGDPNRYGVIAAANPKVDPRRMGAGTELVIPDPGAAPAKSADPNRAAAKTARTGSGETTVAFKGGRPSFLPTGYIQKHASKPVSLQGSGSSRGGGGTYTVRPGDSLALIAQRKLGSSRHADAIAKANAKLIKNPNDLQVGWVLTIPTVD